MNDQVTFDPSGRHNQPQPQRPRRGGPPKIFMIAVLLIGAMFVFKLVGGGMRTQPSGQSLPPLDGGSADRATLPPPDYAIEGSGERSTTRNGDWSIDDGPVGSTATTSSQATRQGNDSTSNGDWKMEDVDTKSQRTARPSRDATKAKSTTKNGDWEIRID